MAIRKSSYRKDHSFRRRLDISLTENILCGKNPERRSPPPDKRQCPPNEFSEERRKLQPAVQPPSPGGRAPRRSAPQKSRATSRTMINRGPAVLHNFLTSSEAFIGPVPQALQPHNRHGIIGKIIIKLNAVGPRRPGGEWIYSQVKDRFVRVISGLEMVTEMANFTGARDPAQNLSWPAMVSIPRSDMGCHRMGSAVPK